MKKNLTTLMLLCGAFAAYSQGSVGLIAHWDMNGTANDVSGNGHNGTAHNITAAAGKDGLMGSGYYFNGTNSYITVPYSASLNLSKFSICAIVKVQGFYNGTCQNNAILTRGNPYVGAAGSYGLSFDDNAFDNADCIAIDSAKDVFYSNSAGLDPASATLRYYTPTITKNTWYTVVVTFNDTIFKTYVNDTLRNSATIATPGVAIGTSTDSISIGYNILQASTYPYPFKGIIDDIRLYNRVLSASEVISYSTNAVPEIAHEKALDIYPNPATTRITISCSDRIYGFVITNLLGQTVYSHEHDALQVQMDVTDLPAGIYFVKINGTEIRKFVKE